MFAFLVKRALSGFLVVVIISMSVYALFWYGPRSPALELCRRDTNNRCGFSTPKLYEYEESLGYHNKIYSEYGKWAKGLVAGRTLMIGTTPFDCPAPCLGLSYRDKQPVSQQLKDKFPVTLSIAIGASTLYLVIGVSVGIGAARRRGTLGDKLLVSSSLVLSSIPYFIFALLALLFLTITTSTFPKPEYNPFLDNPLSWFTGLMLVWLVLGIFGSTSYTRYSRGAMVEALNEDYVRTAKAKGLPDRTIVFRHALRAALVPVVTIFGLDLAGLLGGTLITENIFDLNGIGLWGLQATVIKDLPVVQATTLIFAVIVVIANTLVDIAYSWLDPRVRLS